MKKVISILIIFSMFLSFAASSFANAYDSSSLSSSAKHKNTEIEPYNKESVVTYIDKAYEIESIEIDGIEVNYYIGENFTVVEEGNEYYLIQRDKEDLYNVTVNNIKIETVTSDPYLESTNFDEYSKSPIETLSGDWRYMNTTYRYFNVGRLTVSVAVGLVTGLPGTKAAYVAQILIQDIGGYVLPINYYLTDRIIEHYRLVSGRPEWRKIHQLFHGPSTNRTRSYITSWEQIIRR